MINARRKSCIPAHAFQGSLGELVSGPEDVRVVVGLAPADHWDEVRHLGGLPNEGPVAEVDDELRGRQRNLKKQKTKENLLDHCIHQQTKYNKLNFSKRTFLIYTIHVMIIVAIYYQLFERMSTGALETFEELT